MPEKQSEEKSPAKANATAGETEKPATTEIPAKAESTAKPAEATAPEKIDDTTEKPTDESAGEAAAGVEGYEKMLAEAKARAAKPPEKSAEEAPASEEKPATEETAETETPAAESTETTAPEIPDDEQPSDKRIRLKGLKGGHLVEAANTIAREEDIPFAEAWDRVSPKKAAAETAAEPGPKLRTRAEIDADILARKAEKKQAATDLDTGKMYDADEEIEKLRNELNEVETSEWQAEQERNAAAETKFTAEVNGAKVRTIKNWPEAGEENSAMSKRMVELANAYESDPDLKHHVSEADAPFFFADLAAKELGILPAHMRKPAAAAAPAATKPSPSTATKPAPVNQRAMGRPTQPAASPASGAARTTQGGSKDELGVDKIQSPADYERVVAKAKALTAARR